MVVFDYLSQSLNYIKLIENYFKFFEIYQINESEFKDQLKNVINNIKEFEKYSIYEYYRKFEGNGIYEFTKNDELNTIIILMNETLDKVF